MDLVYFVSQVGFPIAAFCLIYFDLRKLIVANTKALNRQEKALKEVLSKLNG